MTATTPSAYRRREFEEACDLLPAETSWGDHITPDIVLEIAARARAIPQQEQDNPTRSNSIKLESAPKVPAIQETVYCGCGDQIMPDDNAMCGICAMVAELPPREQAELSDEIALLKCWIGNALDFDRIGKTLSGSMLYEANLLLAAKDKNNS